MRRSLTRDKQGVVYIWIVAFAALALLGLMWYFVNIGIQSFLDTMIAEFPTAYDSTTTTLVTNLWLWLGAVMIFALLIWVYVNSQKPEGAITYA